MRRGAWFTVGETRLQGRDNVKKHLLENKELMDSLEQQIYARKDELASKPGKSGKSSGSNKPAEAAIDVTAEDDFTDED